ncbi:DUF4893 domain-containing protein [Paracoccus sediminicola]|uniref:DUF4893 domain-containing protein n=1 Tax=Paracoccus sediminicola TaxID=3017783 RepID=UPI0022F0D0A8|nr:DUF4893 domain-containing protein [Paracoccus sediminicola]WBU58002.1 DUF4893 domain-containing protein [Paracoccus sediminicola]
MATILLAAFAALPALALDQAGNGDFTLDDGAALHAADADKLSLLDLHVGAALREALSGGENGDVAQLVEALGGRPLPMSEARAALEGDWKCRMMKAGDLSPLVVYDDFDCRIRGNSFEKLSGSQRTRGTLHEDDGRVVYLGTGFVAGIDVPAYPDLPAAPLGSAASGQIWADIGIVEAVSDRKARIIFPDPDLESRMNLLFLTR